MKATAPRLGSVLAEGAELGGSGQASGCRAAAGSPAMSVSYSRASRGAVRRGARPLCSVRGRSSAVEMPQPSSRDKRPVEPGSRREGDAFKKSEFFRATLLLSSAVPAGQQKGGSARLRRSKKSEGEAP